MHMGKKNTKAEKKINSRKYGQTEVKNSRMGIYSCVLAGISFVMIITPVLVAFFLRGKTPGIVGGIGLAAVVTALYGLHASVKGRREREKKYWTCWLGMILNILLLLILIFIFAGGFR